MFPAQKIRYWSVGKTSGDLIRKASEAKEIQGDAHKGHTKATHIRRGHWHGFWSGPRNDPLKRRFNYKFLFPILVNPEH